MSGEQLLYLIGSILALIGSYFTARLGAKANTAKVVADQEVGAGQLALNIANRLDNEVLEFRRWRNQIQRWWSDHEAWDDSVANELDRLDPGALERIGPAPRLPNEPELSTAPNPTRPV